MIPTLDTKRHYGIVLSFDISFEINHIVNQVIPEAFTLE